jgi:hypothetical protein
MENRLVSIIWSMSRIHNLPALPARVRYDADFFCTLALPRLETNLCESTRKTIWGIYLHLDNAPAHNAKRLRQEIAQTKVRQVFDRGYSPYFAPSSFFLFGHLKREMAGFPASSPDGILSQIPRTFEEIPKQTLAAVDNERITERHGSDYHTD